MTYTELLNELLDNSGKMMKDIAEECRNTYGVNLTNTYLSSLKTNPERVASDEISRAIAKTCGAEFEDILVVQAYIDKAPQIIKDYLQYVQDTQNMTGDILELFEPQTENPAFQGVMELLDKFKRQSLASFICQTMKEVYKIPDGAQDEFVNLIATTKKKETQAEPKWMVISPEQMKEIRLVNESDIKKLIE